MSNFASGSCSVHTFDTRIPRRAGVSTRHEPTTVWFTHYSEDVTRCNGSLRSWVIADPVIAPRPPKAKLQERLAGEDVTSATPRRCGPVAVCGGRCIPANVADAVRGGGEPEGAIRPRKLTARSAPCFRRPMRVRCTQDEGKMRAHVRATRVCACRAPGERARAGTALAAGLRPLVATNKHRVYQLAQSLVQDQVEDQAQSEP